MSESIWMDSVEDILKERGMSLDDNDGWNFMFDNGFTPAQAVSEMLRN